jgi:hypothetical protein
MAPEPIQSNSVWRRPPLYPKQEAAIFCKERIGVIEASTKAGKAQPLEALLQTPKGPRRMGDIRPGDTVFAVDGKAAMVSAVYPQGQRPIYRVSFSDGALTETDAEHLWEVFILGRSKSYYLTTAEILVLPKLNRICIETAKPVDYPTQPVPLDPYLIGALIGDGGLKYDSVKFSTADPEMIEFITKSLPREHILRHESGCDYVITAGKNAAQLREWGKHLAGTLRDLGLMGKGSHEKRIPKIYLRNSIAVRLAILQGILDTDGFVNKHGQAGLEQTSELLAKDVRELIQSLGGTTLDRIKTVSGYKKDSQFIKCRTVYRQVIRMPDARSLFRLRRKREKATLARKTGRRFFRSIEFVGYKEAQCIEISHHQHLYLTDEFIVTHNTVGCLTWLIEQTVQGKTGQNFWWVAPSYKQATIAYTRAKAGLPKTLFTSNESEHKLVLANGAVMWFLSGEIPDNLFGEDVYAAVIDEASRLREQAWFALRTTLTATRGPVRLIGNVKGKKNFFYRMARRAEAGASDMHFAKITAKDAVAAGVLEQAEIDSAKADLPEMVYRELYEAEPGDDVGNPFGIAAIRACIKPVVRTKPICYGVDLAKSTDWTVIIGLNEHGECCYYERFQMPWLETIIRVHLVVGTDQALIDSTGVGDPIVEYMQRNFGSNYEGRKFTLESKQQMMEGLAVAVQACQTSFPEEVANEMEEYEYTYTRTGVKYSAPEGFNDDCVCAQALAVQKLANLSGAMGLLKYYEQRLKEARDATDDIKHPTPRPAPIIATDPKNDPSPVQAYKATIDKLKLQEICKICGKALDGNRSTDGYDSWHPSCAVPSWAQEPVTFSIGSADIA